MLTRVLVLALVCVTLVAVYGQDSRSRIRRPRLRTRPDVGEVGSDADDAKVIDAVDDQSEKEGRQLDRDRSRLRRPNIRRRPEQDVFVVNGESSDDNSNEEDDLVPRFTPSRGISQFNRNPDRFKLDPVSTSSRGSSSSSLSSSADSSKYKLVCY